MDQQQQLMYSPFNTEYYDVLNIGVRPFTNSEFGTAVNSYKFRIQIQPNKVQFKFKTDTSTKFEICVHGILVE